MKISSNNQQIYFIAKLIPIIDTKLHYNKITITLQPQQEQDDNDSL